MVFKIISKTPLSAAGLKGFGVRNQQFCRGKIADFSPQFSILFTKRSEVSDLVKPSGRVGLRVTLLKGSSH